MTPIQRYLDAAILKPETTREEMIAATKSCIDINVFSVCVRPCDIETAQKLCAGTEVKVCAVLGFPHGDQLPAAKVAEARQYVATGVGEIDMVANYGWVRSGLWEDVGADISGVAGVTTPAGVPLKVILETAQLGAAEIRRMVEVCVEVGADFVKTSTGFNGAGANEEDVRLMLETADGRIKVKASGGIRDREQAEKFLAMGVHRLGLNWVSCVAICTGTQNPDGGA